MPQKLPPRLWLRTKEQPVADASSTGSSSTDNRPVTAQDALQLKLKKLHAR